METQYKSRNGSLRLEVEGTALYLRNGDPGYIARFSGQVAKNLLKNVIAASLVTQRDTLSPLLESLANGNGKGKIPKTMFEGVEVNLDQQKVEALLLQSA